MLSTPTLFTPTLPYAHTIQADRRTKPHKPLPPLKSGPARPLHLQHRPIRVIIGPQSAKTCSPSSISVSGAQPSRAFAFEMSAS